MMKNKQETIEKIKQAALEEFYANGYAKASLRTICRRAGVTKDSESVLKKMMEQSFLTYYRSKLKTVPDKGLIKILAKQRLDSCLQIVKEDYDMEYSLYLVKQIGIYAGGGTERLIESLRKLHRD